MRWTVKQVLDRLDKQLIAVEQRRGIAEPWAILSNRLTTAENRQIWNEHDWTTLGEEWTSGAEWKVGVN